MLWFGVRATAIQKVAAVNKSNKVKHRSPHITEVRFPHIIAIEIPPRGLDAQTSRSILDFHDSRNIQVRFGRANKNFCRWCFSERVIAEAFQEQFGGTYVVKNLKTTVKPTMPNIVAVAFISDFIALMS
jgi:hypothetical protein